MWESPEHHKKIKSINYGPKLRRRIPYQRHKKYY